VIEKKQSAWLIPGLVALTLLVSAPVRADTARFYSARYSPSAFAGFAAQDGSRLQSPIPSYAADFKATDITDPTLAAKGSFMAWSLDRHDELYAGTAYALNAGGTYSFGAPYVVSELNFLPSSVVEVVSDKSGADFYNAGDGDVAPSATRNPAISAAVGPVPEPQTYGMLIAGLVMMGFVAIRRQGAGRSRT